jgi:lauroyl/myristoyl acyltransferase
MWRSYRVFWNFACTFTDTMRFSVNRSDVDWEIHGAANLAALNATEEGAIILTAHMGNYDLGSYLLAKTSQKRVAIVRAAEHDPDSDHDSRSRREEYGTETGKLKFFEPSAELALELVHALQEGRVVAIQGDRVINGVASLPVKLFGRNSELPAGPFALAMTTQVLIYPLFVVRLRRRTYRVIVADPIACRRTGANREEDIQRAMTQWVDTLQSVVGQYSDQWFNFEPYFKESA